MNVITGNFKADGLRFGIVVARFNEMITQKLLEGAIDAFCRHGASESDLTIAWVPGSFEIPLVAKKMAQTGNFDAVLCLGAVIRGVTGHYDHVAGQAAAGIAQAAMETDVPVLFGVLTTDTIEQAIERSGTKAGNKGFETAVAAIETANVLKKVTGPTIPKQFQESVFGKEKVSKN